MNEFKNIFKRLKTYNIIYNILYKIKKGFNLIQ